jgi:putative transposase
MKRIAPARYMKDRERKALIAESVYVRNDGYRQTDRELVLSKELRIPFKAGDLWVGKQGRLELHYDKLRSKWCGRIPVEVRWPRKREPHQPTPKRASIDLGICNLTTCAVEGSRTACVYSGRAVLSDWRYWTKHIAKRQMQLVKVNGKRTSKTVRAMLRARKRRLDHAVDAMLRDLYERLEEQGVTKLVIGDLKHVRENADHGKVGNQKLHNFWVFQKMRKRITELSEEYGIKALFKSERNTSKRCSICGQTHEQGRMHRGLYRCEKTGRTLNADVNGALNILYGRKVAALSGSRPMARPLLLRWNRCGWESKHSISIRERSIPLLEAGISRL